MRIPLRLSGYLPTLPTPFDATGELDVAAVQRLCLRQIEAGAGALVVCEATGEPWSLSKKELEAVVRAAVDCACGRLPVIAGATSNATSQAVQLAGICERAGANAILSVVPYYNKPTQSGMYAHFRAVAEATALPVILHDVPARTVCGLSDDTVVRLAEQPRIIGLLDAGGDLARLLRLRALIGPEFNMLSGDDTGASAYRSFGGDGWVSVVGNVAPHLCRALLAVEVDGRGDHVRRLATFIARLTEALLLESNPGPLKYALGKLQLMQPQVRLPLVEPSAATVARIDTLLAELAAVHPELQPNLARQSNRRLVTPS